MNIGQRLATRHLRLLRVVTAITVLVALFTLAERANPVSAATPTASPPPEGWYAVRVNEQINPGGATSTVTQYGWLWIGPAIPDPVTQNGPNPFEVCLYLGFPPGDGAIAIASPGALSLLSHTACQLTSQGRAEGADIAYVFAYQGTNQKIVVMEPDTQSPFEYDMDYFFVQDGLVAAPVSVNIGALILVFQTGSNGTPTVQGSFYLSGSTTVGGFMFDQAQSVETVGYPYQASLVGVLVYPNGSLNNPPPAIQ